MLSGWRKGSRVSILVKASRVCSHIDELWYNKSLSADDYIQGVSVVL